MPPLDAPLKLFDEAQTPEAGSELGTVPVASPAVVVLARLVSPTMMTVVMVMMMMAALAVASVTPASVVVMMMAAAVTSAASAGSGAAAATAGPPAAGTSRLRGRDGAERQPGCRVVTEERRQQAREWVDIWVNQDEQGFVEVARKLGLS